MPKGKRFKADEKKMMASQAMDEDRKTGKKKGTPEEGEQAMRKFAKDEAKMREFADGSGGSLSKKGTHKGKKVKTGHHARAGKRIAVKKRKNWKHTGAKSKLA